MALSSESESIASLRAYDIRRRSFYKNCNYEKGEGIDKNQWTEIEVRLISTMTVNGQSLARARVINQEREISLLMQL